MQFPYSAWLPSIDASSYARLLLSLLSLIADLRALFENTPHDAHGLESLRERISQIVSETIARGEGPANQLAPEYVGRLLLHSCAFNKLSQPEPETSDGSPTADRGASSRSRTPWQALSGIALGVANER